MALATTVIGSYPKPDYLQLPDWFRTGHDNYAATDLNQFRKALTSEGNLYFSINPLMLMSSSREIVVWIYYTFDNSLWMDFFFKLFDG